MIQINVRILLLIVEIIFNEKYNSIGFFFYVYLEICLCTTAKRDSLYDDPNLLITKNNERQSAEQYGFVRTGKL